MKSYCNFSVVDSILELVIIHSWYGLKQAELGVDLYLTMLTEWLINTMYATMGNQEIGLEEQYIKKEPHVLHVPSILHAMDMGYASKNTYLMCI